MPFIRALLAFLSLPAVVAGLVPALIVRGRGVDPTAAPFAATLLAVGGVLLVWCVRDFYVTGRGTLAPWDPPRRLVVVGLYRFVRNPMYLAVAAILGGWALLFRSPGLAVYLAIVIAAFHLRVVFYEEPTLKALFGADWDDYCRTVRRWIPTIGRPRQ